MKATVHDGKAQREWTPADTQVLAPDTPYAWVDVVAEDLDTPAAPAPGRPRDRRPGHGLPAPQ